MMHPGAAPVKRKKINNYLKMNRQNKISTDKSRKYLKLMSATTTNNK